MKWLIWSVFMILNACLQITIQEMASSSTATSERDIIIEAFFTALLAGVTAVLCIWIPNVLCKKLDWYRIKKKATEAGMTVSEYGKQGLPKEFLATLEKLCNTVPYEQVKASLKKCVKKGKITKEQFIILLDEYSIKK